MLDFLRFLKHIIVSAWKNATPAQAALINLDSLFDIKIKVELFPFYCYVFRKFQL